MEATPPGAPAEQNGEWEQMGTGTLLPRLWRIGRHSILLLVGISLMPTPALAQDGERGPGRGGSNWEWGAGVLAGALLYNAIRPQRSSSLTRTLDEDGPQFPRQYGLSILAVQGYLQGNWPMVIDYQMEQASLALVEISLPGVEPFYYRLDGNNLERREALFTLPERFGDRPRAGLIIIRALQDGVGVIDTAPMRVYGMGVGPSAVGSMLIRNVHFQPETLTIVQRGRCGYSFNCRALFPRMKLIVYRLSNESGTPQRVAVRTEPLSHGAGIGDHGARDWWDGKRKGTNSLGLHELLVKGWRTDRTDKSWTFARSEERVSVSVR